MDTKIRLYLHRCDRVDRGLEYVMKDHSLLTCLTVLGSSVNKILRRLFTNTVVNEGVC